MIETVACMAKNKLCESSESEPATKAVDCKAKTVTQKMLRSSVERKGSTESVNNYQWICSYMQHPSHYSHLIQCYYENIDHCHFKV